MSWRSLPTSDEVARACACYSGQMTIRARLAAELGKIGFGHWRLTGTWMPEDQYDTYLMKLQGICGTEKAGSKRPTPSSRSKSNGWGLDYSPHLRDRSLRTAVAIESYVHSDRQ